MKKYRYYVLPALMCLIVGLVFRFALAGYSFGAYAIWAVGAAFLYFMALRHFSEKYPKVCLILNKTAVYAIIILIFVTITTLAIIIQSSSDADNSGADYAVVLGAGVNGTTPSASLSARLRAAEEYARSNPDTILILSGGQGGGESITEAQCMYNWLTNRGIDADRLILEERSGSTEENLAFSAEIIFGREPDFDGRICVVTESYHLCRAKLYAHRAGLERVVGQGAYTGLPVLTGIYYLRECVALWWGLIN